MSLFHDTLYCVHLYSIVLYLCRATMWYSRLHLVMVFLCSGQIQASSSSDEEPLLRQQAQTALLQQLQLQASPTKLSETLPLPSSSSSSSVASSSQTQQTQQHLQQAQLTQLQALLLLQQQLFNQQQQQQQQQQQEASTDSQQVHLLMDSVAFFTMETGGLGDHVGIDQSAGSMVI